MFYTLNNADGTSPDVLRQIFSFIGIPFVIFSTIALYIFLSFKNGFSYKAIETKTTKIISLILCVVLLIPNCLFFIHSMGLDDYVWYQFSDSNFIEDNYKNPKDVKITFPQNKKNLIFIFSESMESSFTSIENGGFLNTDAIPELTQLAKENINFSNTDKLGGALPTYGSTWTTAGIVSHTFGIPLKVGGGIYETGELPFLPGAYSMFEILKDNGYNMLSIKGSKIKFGGIGKMLKDHGDMDYFDYNTAIDTGKIPEDYLEFWGYEDIKLFEYSKEKITNMANGDKPFMVTVETIDTHYPDGYRCEECESIYGYQYPDVVRCASKQISSFIKWAQQQTWYENTTIVVVGDHLTMKSNMFGDDQSNNRTTFNLFVNSVAQSENVKNRQFMTADMFPTILASIGCEIEGDKLGLGTNLFSKSQTLYEEFGYDFVNEELKKKSIFYTDKIM